MPWHVRAPTPRKTFTMAYVQGHICLLIHIDPWFNVIKSVLVNYEI